MKNIIKYIVALYDRILEYVYAKQVYDYLAWIDYETGFAGSGPTPFDRKPETPKPQLPKRLEDKCEASRENFRKIKQEAFRQSCIENLGEDPNDWK